MKTVEIDTSRIESMIAKLKTAATRPENGIKAMQQDDVPLQKADFASVLKASLDGVNNAQKSADALAKRFVAGDDSVNLSDVMINSQKASIAFQATVQVRNKLVSAYHDIMNMQV